MSDGQFKLEVEVAARVSDRSGAISLELRPISEPLPPFKAGSHIDIFLANGLIRSYSLMNSEAERDRYLCGIARDRNSRGGSAYIHEQVSTGTVLAVGRPRNLFPLDEEAQRSVLFAGGIGVTPLLSMARRLEALGRDWQLYHCAQSRERAPFFQELEAFGGERVVGRFDDESPREFLDFAAKIRAEKDSTHFYCCGPAPMIAAFEAARGTLPAERFHLERFSAASAAVTEGGFTVVLARSDVTLLVPPGKSILEVLEQAGIEVPFSCLAGICGSCVTPVLAGTPDHRDLVLTDREKNRNDQMMICCSGSLSQRLVLDR